MILIKIFTTKTHLADTGFQIVTPTVGPKGI